METCDRCKKQAQTKVLWAEGKAYIPACWSHAGGIRREKGDDFSGFRRFEKSWPSVTLSDEPATPEPQETCAKCPRKAHARVLHGQGHTSACWQHAGQIRRERGTSFKGWHRLTKAEEAPHVALVLAYDGHGRLLLGQRNDNQKWTLPGGHLNPGEDPEAGAARELREETGLVAGPLHRVFVRPNPPGGPVLHVFSTSSGGHPHGALDPDRECSEWQWHDVAGGVPPEVWDTLAGPPDDLNVVRQIHRRAPGAMLKSEPLEKNHPTPTFPGLGLPDDRRETPIVDGKAWNSKRRAMAALHAQNNPHAPDHQEHVRSTWFKEYGRETAGMASGTSGVHASFAVGNKTRQRAFPNAVARSPQVHLDEKADVSTKLHEDWHQMMLRVQEKHGRLARKAVARHLAEGGIPDMHAHELHMLGSTMHPQGGRDHEERIATLLNYMNSPGYRNEFHSRLNHAPGSPQWRTSEQALKGAYQHVVGAAARLTPEKVSQLSTDGLPDDRRSVFEAAKSEELVQKSDVGAAALLEHHDHRERQLAILAGALTPHQLVHALLDPHPEVQHAASQHPHCSPHVQRIAQAVQAARAQRKGFVRE